MLAAVRLAEAAGLDAVTLTDDGPDPAGLLARLAAVTERIGLIGTLPAAHGDPLELARRLADLDFLSGGRVGWHVGSDNPTGAARFGALEEPGRPERARRRTEAVGAVLARWNRRNDLLSAQGRPVLVWPGGAEVAGVADVVIHARSTAHDNRDPEHGRGERAGIARSRAFRTAVRATAHAAGRDPDAVLVLPAVTTLLSSTEHEAREVTPLPARRDGHRAVAGTPGRVADELERWVRAGAADGFDVVPGGDGPDALEAFTEHLVPELRRRGLFRDGYENRTLRGHLGLPVAPAGRRRAASLTGSR
ncbi:LLM class flavin-dependent oxidoreductase [Kineosporia sp. J2-2]|uniref:LLM class flavin-dependent oxidoreductase n=1 Tax=Kineosporia corallincola TaxID=2835133 RepID=A0ABS5TFX0_9ACTN|nr:LLM class flavin-dependent oxidoreductase [Kineosporia corallincola]